MYENETEILTEMEKIMDEIKKQEEQSWELYILSDEDRNFLSIVHNKNIRKALLERLRDLGELPAFLEVENGTK
jgi:hypothetical protein